MQAAQEQGQSLLGDMDSWSFHRSTAIDEEDVERIPLVDELLVRWAGLIMDVLRFWGLKGGCWRDLHHYSSEAVLWVLLVKDVLGQLS